jgi:hypothetical protein
MSILKRITALEERVEELWIIDTEDIMAEDTGDGIALHLQSPNNAEPASADGYEGYFKVVKIDDTNVKVIDGALPDADICGYVRASGQSIHISTKQFTASAGSCYVRIWYDDETKKYNAELKIASELPSVAHEVNIELATIDIAEDRLTIVQRWKDGEIDINGEYWT